MTARNRDFIPALNQGWLTPLYDWVLRAVMREEVFKQQLVEQVDPQAGERVLDLGCGTGTLTLLLRRHQPGAALTGMDVDEKVLEIARQKSLRVGLPAIGWEKGAAGALPYPDAAFDLVVSSLVIHHLTLAEKRGAFREVRRVLKPGGRFYLLDFGPPRGWWMRLAALIMVRLEHTAENFAGRLPRLMEEAGLAWVEESGHWQSVFGTLYLYRAFRVESS